MSTQDTSNRKHPDPDRARVEETQLRQKTGHSLHSSQSVRLWLILLVALLFVGSHLTLATTVFATKGRSGPAASLASETILPDCSVLFPFGPSGVPTETPTPTPGTPLPEQTATPTTDTDTITTIPGSQGEVTIQIESPSGQRTSTSFRVKAIDLDVETVTLSVTLIDALGNQTTFPLVLPFSWCAPASPATLTPSATLAPESTVLPDTKSPTTVPQPTTSPSTIPTHVLPTPTKTDTSTPGAGKGPGGCTEKSPYGFTTIHGDLKLVELYRSLRACWLRYQIDESALNTNMGLYDWRKLDAVVALMNANGIHLSVPLACFAGISSSGGCFSNTPPIPTPAQMTNYASQIASRYNGRNGHGVIAAFEIGNEEYDQDTFRPEPYSSLLRAGYQAIKAVHPTALVGMYGTYRPNLSHLETVLSAVRASQVKIDFSNVHYYGHGLDPRVSDSKHPSLRDVIQTVKRLMPEVPLWVTEIGWTVGPKAGMQVVSPEVQADYLEFVLEEASTSGIVERVFIYTINYPYENGKSSIYHSTQGPLPAFERIRQMIARFPEWNITLPTKA